MAVTIEKRPVGVVLGSAVSANINQDYSSAFATVNKTGHGLSDGQYVYIKSNVSRYNGFWKIDVTNANEFLLIDAPYVAWIVDANITYYPQQSTHGWSAAETPIVYELSNTRYPTNSVDTTRTVSTIANDAGYVRLNLSGSLGTFEELAFIKISNAANTNLNGVYQVVDKISTSAVIINLSYAAVTNAGLVGASVQLYYQNYNILVRVYAGLNSLHGWASLKPYELAATLQFVPESNNRVRFSVSEILKSYLETKNDLTQPSLPNNLDAWAQFYIEVAESYDTSNGYTVTTTTSGYASDQTAFEGYAINAKLPFKNVHSGYMSDYVMNNTTAKFLTLFSIPVLFSCSDDLPDCYSDVSFINPYDNVSLKVKKEYMNNGVVLNTQTDSIGTPDAGVIRVELEPNCSYQQVKISLLSNPFIDYLQRFINTGAGTDWTLGSQPSATVSSGNTSKSLTGTFVQSDSTQLTYTISYSFTRSGSGFVTGAALSFLDEAGNVLGTSSTITINTGQNVGTASITSNGTARISKIRFNFTSSGGTNTVTVNSLSDVTDFYQTSETKTFDIDCGCADQEMRLTWLNNLGGFDYWTFQAQADHNIEIGDSGTTSENVFPDWPNSWGETADTIRKQTFRDSNEAFTVRSQFLTQDQVDAIAYVKSSILVQVINSQTDRRTVLVDTDSFLKYKDGDKTYTVQFNISYTNDLPSQTA